MITSSSILPLSRWRGGFGLVELMVSIGIMVLVMSVVIVNHNSFSRGSLLRSQAYEIALRLREVQLLAVSTRVSDDADPERVRYGAHFSALTGSRFQIFAIPESVDADEYDDHLIGAPGILDSRFTITQVTRVNSSGAESPLPTGEGVVIVFNRPNFDAEFFDPANVSSSKYDSINEVRLYVDSVRNPGSPRKVIVTKAGQISVQ